MIGFRLSILAATVRWEWCQFLVEGLVDTFPKWDLPRLLGAKAIATRKPPWRFSMLGSNCKTLGFWYQLGPYRARFGDVAGAKEAIDSLAELTSALGPMLELSSQWLGGRTSSIGRPAHLERSKLRPSPWPWTRSVKYWSPWGGLPDMLLHMNELDNGTRRGSPWSNSHGPRSPIARPIAALGFHSIGIS